MATDAVDSDVNVTCEPKPGITFALGEVTINCSATDRARNTATDSFNATLSE